MELLVLTFWIAIKLKWHEKDFSDTLDASERLGEDKLKVVVGIYAKKQCQKQWYDTKIHSKNFQMVDLVLLYTLKKKK